MQSLKVAMKCLNSIERFLVEFLFLESFSVGMDDLVLSHFVSRRNNFMEEIGNETTGISRFMKHLRGGRY